MKPRLKPVVAGLVAALLVLAASDAAVLHVLRAPAADFDGWVRAAVHSCATPGLTRAVELLTDLGSTWMLLALALVWLVPRRRCWFPLAALGLSVTVTETVKLIVRRHRPDPWFGIPPPETWSFPSGHSLNSMAVYVVMGAMLARMLPPFAARSAVALSIAVPLLIGLTRIYLGVHWPTDVLTGWAAGACLAIGLLRSREIV